MNINPIIDIPNQYKMLKKVINKYLEIMEGNKKEDNKNKLWIMNKSLNNKIKIIAKVNNWMEKHKENILIIIFIEELMIMENKKLCNLEVLLK